MSKKHAPPRLIFALLFVLFDRPFGSQDFGQMGPKKIIPDVPQQVAVGAGVRDRRLRLRRPLRVVDEVVFGCQIFCKLGVCSLGISRRGDFLYGAQDILAPQPEAKNWSSEEDA